MSDPRLRGAIAAAAIPLRDDFSIDLSRLVKHCRWLLEKHGCDGITLLGTTGEATSFSVSQRVAAMRAIAESGLPLERFFAGTGAAALEDAVVLTRCAHELGYAGALLLPPFYYKGIDTDGLLRFMDELVGRMNGETLRLYLYHFPALSGVPFSHEVIGELLARHPGKILGLKDSTGSLESSSEFARRFPSLDVFPAFDAALLRAGEFRFAGCITGTLNITGPLVRTGLLEDARLIGEAMARFPLFAAVKAALADMFDEPEWLRVCPPLRPLSEAERAELSASLAGTRYLELRAALNSRSFSS